MRIPEIQAKPENGDYVLKEDLIESYENEYGILQYLTDSRCKSTPLHITNFERNEANPWTLNGFLCFVIMTKVPGVPVSDIWTESPTGAQQMEQRQIMNAFKNALMEVTRFGVVFEDTALRNVIWDKAESKCYLIDFESSELFNFRHDIRWENLLSSRVHPDYTLIIWGFENDETRKKMAEYDEAPEPAPGPEQQRDSATESEP